MIVQYQSIRVIKEEISPEEHGKALADELWWEFNKSLDKQKTNEEAQTCVDSFVIQLYRRFNLQGYNLDIEELTNKIKEQ